MVPPARLELALPKEPDFESGASTNSATGATEIFIYHILNRKSESFLICRSVLNHSDDKKIILLDPGFGRP